MLLLHLLGGSVVLLCRNIGYVSRYKYCIELEPFFRQSLLELADVVVSAVEISNVHCTFKKALANMLNDYLLLNAQILKAFCCSISFCFASIVSLFCRQ